MARRWKLFDLVFGVASAGLVLFLVAPIVSIVLGTPPVEFWRTLFDTEVIRSLWLTFAASLIAVGLVCSGRHPAGVPAGATGVPQQAPGAILDQPADHYPAHCGGCGAITNGFRAAWRVR